MTGGLVRPSLDLRDQHQVASKLKNIVHNGDRWLIHHFKGIQCILLC